MGARFWVWLIAVTIGIGVAGLILFLLIDAAWYRWGFLGGFLIFAAILLLIGWIMDRRSQRRYDDYEATSG